MKENLNSPVVQATDIIFKMHQDGRMDKEEATLLLDVIFSGHMDDETFHMIRFIHKVRPHGGISDLEEDEWRTIADFSSMPQGGIRADKLMRLLGDEEK